MRRLLRLIIALSITFACVSCAGVAWAYHHSDRQSLRQGELQTANIPLDNPSGINASQLGRVGELLVVTPEPVSLVLFGFGLTMAGITLLRSSGRSKLSTNTGVARWAVGKRCKRLARIANVMQYPSHDFSARNRLVATCMFTGSK